MLTIFLIIIKLRELFKKLERVSYCCPDCGHAENISELTCAHYHKLGRVTFDKSKNYPAVCISYRDKGLYVRCSQCKIRLNETLFADTLRKKLILTINPRI